MSSYQPTRGGAIAPTASPLDPPLVINIGGDRGDVLMFHHPKI